MTERTEQAKAAALARFADTGDSRANCAQAVVSFALDLMEGDLDLMTVARYFGGGIASMGEACGALTGGVMALGLRDLRLPAGSADPTGPTKEQLQTVLRDFSAAHGSMRCRELTGHDLSTPEGYKAFRGSEANLRCPIYVGWVCDRIAPLLDKSADAAGADS